VVQWWSRYRGGAEVLSLCTVGAEVVQRWCSRCQQCRWCTGARTQMCKCRGRGAEVQVESRGGGAEVQRCRCRSASELS